MWTWPGPLLVVAIAGCGSAGHPVAKQKLLECTHHLVFASSGLTNGRMIALSFDDTPSSSTEAIYGILLHYHVKATFFVIGDRIPGRASLLRTMVDSGMELGNHSYTHPPTLATEGPGASTELTLTSAAIQQATGFRPCLFRPPYGVVTPDLVQRAKEADMTTTKWSIDSGDWTHPGVVLIRERVLGAARPGAIVVMHDNVLTRGQTAAALPGIIEGLQARGLHMVTVSQLLGDTLYRGSA